MVEDVGMPQDMTGLAIMVGEMRGQLREVVHTLNNVSSKIDAVSREVISMGPLATEIAELRGDLKLANVEIDKLKEERAQRVGAIGLAEWTIKHWPGIAGFVVLVVLVLRAQGVFH